MIKLSATIQLLKAGLESDEKGKLELVTLADWSDKGNNISNAGEESIYMDNITNTKKPIRHPFIFGRSTLGNGDTFFAQLGYFMGGQLSASGKTRDGEYMFTTSYKLTLSGEAISAITFAFDDLHGEYPYSMMVDGTEYFDDDAAWTILLEPKSEHTVIISNWNTPNHPIIISGIYVELTLDIDRRNTQNIDFSYFDRADTNLTSYGIYSNGGSINLIDINTNIKDYIDLQILKNGLVVKLYLEDTLSKVKQQIGQYVTDDWDYNPYTQETTVSLTDGLQEWQDIMIDEIGYDVENGKSMTFGSFYSILRNLTPENYEMLSLDELDEKTKNHLNSSVLVYPMLQQGSLWNAWDKFCVAMQGHIYKLPNGKTTFVYSEEQ